MTAGPFFTGARDGAFEGSINPDDVEEILNITFDQAHDDSSNRFSGTCDLEAGGALCTRDRKTTPHE